MAQLIIYIHLDLDQAWCSEDQWPTSIWPRTTMSGLLVFGPELLHSYSSFDISGYHHCVLPASDGAGVTTFVLLSSFELAENIRWHGISSPSWCRSLEYCLTPVVVHVITPSLLRNAEHATEIYFSAHGQLQCCLFALL